jgi:Uma2 family endonuclease
VSTATLHRNKNGAGEIQSARTGAVPPLLNGDHLTVPEFERRYWAMPETKKAELIEGVVIMSSPTSPIHGRTHGLVTELVSRYARTSGALDYGVNASVRLDGKNEYQPDIVLRIKEDKVAGTRIGADGLLEGAPEFVAEIAVSSVGYDLHEKKAVYQRGLVREYFVWQVMDSKIHWFALEQGEFVELKPRQDGVICSRTFPGLWLNVQAMLAGNGEKVSRTLDKGIKSPEHQTFLKRLAEKDKS